MKLYCVTDLKAKQICNVFTAPSDEFAERSFLMLLTAPSSSLFTDFPEDFALYPLGDLTYSNGVQLVGPGAGPLIEKGFNVENVHVIEPLKNGNEYDKRYLSMVRSDRSSLFSKPIEEESSDESE